MKIRLHRSFCIVYKIVELLQFLISLELYAHYFVIAAPVNENVASSCVQGSTHMPTDVLIDARILIIVDYAVVLAGVRDGLIFINCGKLMKLLVFCCGNQPATP